MKTKYILIAFFAFFQVANVVKGKQTTEPQVNSLHNFVFQNKSVHWISIYKDSADSSAVIVQLLFKQLSQTKNLNNIQIVGNTITGKILNESSTNLLTSSHNTEIATFFIEIKNGKYRVDVHDIRISITSDNALSGSTSNMTYTIEKLYTKKDCTAWKNSANKGTTLLDEEYNKYFKLIKNPQKSTW
ncbi:MAG TPA: hypothetical protein VNG53_10665 [Bacteroidia bacterium]|nr:hypothetical protein [Bacteroidia bacterium]